MNQLSLLSFTAATLVALAVPAAAVTVCKAKVGKNAGTINVSASTVTGTAKWGATPTTVTNAFANAATCVVSGKAKEL